MPNFSKMKLGKLPSVNDPRTLKLAKYFLDTLPPAPPSVDYTCGITSFGEMLNDNLSDCVIAACGHAEQIWTAVLGDEYTATDAQVEQRYSEWCGYVPGNPGTDNGCIELDVLNGWRKKGFWKHLLIGYADPDPMNLEHIKQAIYLFGGVFIGVQLPVSAQTQNVWDVSSGPDAIPGSWGGHGIFVPKYRTDTDGNLIFTGITWGELIDITQAFWTYNDPDNGPYLDEAHALIGWDFVTRKGKTPVGLDIAQMKTDVQLLTGAT